MVWGYGIYSSLKGGEYGFYVNLNSDNGGGCGGYGIYISLDHGRGCWICVSLDICGGMQAFCQRIK